MTSLLMTAEEMGEGTTADELVQTASYLVLGEEKTGPNKC